MKRAFMLVLALAALVLPSGAAAFHHVAIPPDECASPNAGSPSHENGEAREHLLANGLIPPPLAPFGTPGANQSQGAAHCQNNRS